VSRAEAAAHNSARKIVERKARGIGTEAHPAEEIKPARAKVASVAMTSVGIEVEDQEIGLFSAKNDTSSS
jgi:hypothetical protein